MDGKSFIKAIKFKLDNYRKDVSSQPRQGPEKNLFFSLLYHNNLDVAVVFEKEAKFIYKQPINFRHEDELQQRR